MKDLEGEFGAEKKCVTGNFLWCFGFFGGKNVKNIKNYPAFERLAYLPKVC
jgi:hypothetical protein